MTRPPRTAVIFCAGFGTRLASHAAGRPKPLVPIAGVTMLDRAMTLARKVGASKIFVNTHHLASQVANHLADEPDTFVSHEEPRILDTGGGLKQMAGRLDEAAVYTINPDAVWVGPNPLDRLAASWDDSRMGALLMLVPAASAHGHDGKGDFRLEENGSVRRCSPGDPGLVYGGAQIVRVDEVRKFPGTAFSLNAVWDVLLASKRLYGTVYEGSWIDTGNPLGLAIAEETLSNGSSPGLHSVAHDPQVGKAA
ncbi:MAG: nucleotidyltransferase family protein [Rhodobacteraceae bacterium]|nr:nucleotidyltransferase family protein [Paracoccaceae bacterium]